MATALITRAEARAQGLKRYFTGAICPHGHVAERLVSTFACVECLRIKSDARSLPGGSRQPKGLRAAKMKARAEAREKGQTRYFDGEPCPKGHVADRDARNGACLACRTEWKRAYRNANRDKVRAQGRALRAADPDKHRASTQRWQQTPDGRAAKARLQRERRARLRGSDGSHTQQDIEEILVSQGHRCAYCRTDIRGRHEVDQHRPAEVGRIERTAKHSNGLRSLQPKEAHQGTRAIRAGDGTSDMKLPSLKGLLPWRKKAAAEGAYRPGPYMLSDGWLSASAGKLLNFWQAGHSLNPYGEGGAMVEACVSAYSQTVAMCPGAHKKTTGDGGSEIITTSDLSRILKRPNDYESISDFLLNLTERLYRGGEAFAYAVRNNRNEIVELHRMRYGYPYIGTDGSIFYSLSGNEIAEQRFDLSAPVPARDVLHVRLKTPRHPLKGVSPILAVALDQALSGAALNQQIAFYLNEAKPSFMLETDSQLTAEQTQTLRSLWDAQTKGDGAGGTPILTWGLKAKQVSNTAKDSLLADMLKLSDQNIALAFRMPLQILGIGGTPFASTEALMSAWKSTGLGFALNHIEEAFGLLFRLKGQPDEYLEFDTDALLRSSFKEMMDALVAGTDQVLTKNEARARIGLARKTGGDDLFMQMQDIAIGKPVAAPAPADEPPAPANDDEDEPEEISAADGKMVGAMIYAKFSPTAELLRITQQ